MTVEEHDYKQLVNACPLGRTVLSDLFTYMISTFGLLQTSQWLMVCKPH